MAPDDTDGRGDPSGADALLAAFARWAADERVGAAAAARTRERWLRQQASEGATLIGTLVDLAERYADVAVVVDGRTVNGRLVGVGRDACMVADPSGAATVIAVAHLAAVRVTGRRVGGGEATGARGSPGDWSMAGALGALAAERAPVRLGLAGGEPIAGTLVSLGEDILTVRLAADGVRAHVALSAVGTATPL